MSTEKHAKHSSKKEYAIATVALILAAVILIVVTKSYPVALAGGGLIFARELDVSYKIAKQLDKGVDKGKILDQLINNRKKKDLAGSVNIEQEKDFYVSGRSEDYSKFLNDYLGGDEKLFEKYIVSPQAYDAALRIKYNNNFGANNNQYNKAQNIITRLNNGQSFEELAQTMSDDKVSGQLGGDLGFVAKGELLPELEKAIDGSALGEVKQTLVVSRHGYHVLYPVQTATRDGQQVWHVKHILVQTDGYEEWLDSQLGSIKSYKLN